MPADNEKDKKDKLKDGKQFGDWWAFIKATLMDEEVYYVLAQEYPSWDEREMVDNGTGGLRLENLAELTKRQDKYKKDVRRVNKIIFDWVAKGSDAMGIIREVTEGDGKVAAAAAALQEAYDHKAMVNVVNLLIKLLNTKQAGMLQPFITKFKGQLRELKENGLDLQPQLRSAFFLISLATSFKPFVTQQLLLDEIDPDAMYTKALEFEATTRMQGEADTTDTALAATTDTNTNRGTGRDHQPRPRENMRYDCLHADCDGHHHVYDCPKHTREEGKKVMAAFRAQKQKHKRKFDEALAKVKKSNKDRGL